MAAQLEVLTENPGVMKYGFYKNIGVCVWLGQATRASVSSVQEAVKGLLTRSPEMHSFIHVINSGVPLPDASARSGMVDLMKRYEARTACAAIVIGGSGFWAGGMRSAVTSLRLLAPRSFEYRLHGRVREVVPWLAQEHSRRSGVNVSQVELSELVDQIEAWQKL